jgi:hypothetical protein
MKLTADVAQRTITGLMLPYNEVGHTNLGGVKASADAPITFGDNITLNMEHDATRPVGRIVGAPETTNEGIVATFKVAATTAGNDLLAEVSEGLRTGLSVEIDDPVIRDGNLLGGMLSACAAVVNPAFDSARVMTAADAGNLPATIVIDGVTYTAVPDPTTNPTQDPNSAAQAAETENDVTETVTAAASPVAASLNAAQTKNVNKLGAAMVSDKGATLQMFAALDQAISSDLAPTQVGQWLGEIYGSKTYTRKFAGLVQHGNLTALKAIGWRFITGKTPAVGDYAGFPAQPNSNEVKTEAVTLDALRLAGAGSVDRAFLDFPVPEFWTGYFREVTNSYERQVDGKIRDAMIAGATAVTGGTIPTGVSKAATYIIDGALPIIAAERDLPSWAIIGSDLWRDFMLTRADDMLAFLNASLGLEDGTIKNFKILPSAVATLTGKVLVGTGTAATLFELPGASPVRVDAVNIAQGGADQGVFGYHAELINDATGLSLVSAGV